MVGCKNLIDWDFLKIIFHFPLGAMPYFGGAFILASFGGANVRSALAEIVH
jgi:hypothetical protein